jgi:chorismate dehydratase
MIGDAALQASFIEQDFHIYDLGEIWYRWTGLPFVFALWLCRREMSENLQLKILAQQLIDAKERAPSHYEQIAKEAPERAWMGYDRLLSYWRYNISYQLDDSTLSGLVTFFEKCHVAGLISCVPSLQFIGL